MTQKQTDRPRIALWFRYGPAEHAELFHAMPDIVEALAEHAEVHYFGCASSKPVPERIARNAVIHHLLFTVDRSNSRDKAWKTFLWLLNLPRIGLWCRRHGIAAVYIDETMPLTAPLARLFFGPKVAMTIADFFVDVYAEHNAFVRATGALIKRLDFAAWRKLPLIFTRAKATQPFLSEYGIPADRVHPVYDPCDFDIYRPLPDSSARQTFDIPDSAVVLVHHGILHPNKGNDRILKAIARSRDRFPNLVYLLIGDGPDMPRLRKLVDELDLSAHVRFTGWLPTLEAVNEALNAGDIGLVMRIGQRSDDFHMTGALVHSMACGLPVLAARLGGISEVITDNHNGFLFDPHELHDFPDQLEKLHDSEETRKRLGDAARQDALQLFSIPTITQQTVAPLLNLLG